MLGFLFVVLVVGTAIYFGKTKKRDDKMEGIKKNIEENKKEIRKLKEEVCQLRKEQKNLER